MIWWKKRNINVYFVLSSGKLLADTEEMNPIMNGWVKVYAWNPGEYKKAFFSVAYDNGNSNTKSGITR
jgi:hypothetical protein